MTGRPKLSIVVPMYREEDNVLPLVSAVDEALGTIDYELILVDDGSDDATFQRICEAQATQPRVVAIQLRRNFGQTAAMSAGFDAARGDIVAYMDGDLQTDPNDILRLIERLEKEDLDLINGWRKQRHDKGLTRNLPSKLANALIRRMTGVYLHDYGCPMKVMRADVAKNLRLYGEQHRFLPALAALYGARIGEEVVRHRPRRAGESKYGLERTLRVVVDLLLVMFFQRFSDRPSRLFGPAGLFSFFTGLIIDGWLSIEKLFFGAELANRPMLQLGSLLIVSGLLLFGTGLILEMQARTYYEATGRQHYSVRRRIGGIESAGDAD